MAVPGAASRILRLSPLLLPLLLLLAPPVPAYNVTISVTETLLRAKEFNVMAGLLTASGVAAELDAHQASPGITLFAPTDAAFAEAGDKVKGLPADKKAMLLRYHALHSYKSLVTLSTLKNPSQATFATEVSKVGGYTLNITGTTSSVTISSGITEVTLGRSIIDQPSVSIFGVSKVLLPRIIYVTNAA